MKPIRSFVYTAILAALCSFFTIDGVAQELEPRSQASAPVKLNVFFIAYSYSWGNILLDQALPIEDAKAKANVLTLGYASTINLFGRLAKLDVVVPFSFGTWEGLEEGLPVSVTRTGFGDPLVRLGINLIGTPALYGRDFINYKEKFILGAGMQVRLPIGQYDGDKLVNLSTNRWMFKPNVGAALNMGRWIIETSINANFFTTNKDFFGGNTLWQKPLIWLQMHLAYRFRRGFWLAASIGRGWGGETVFNGEGMGNLQNNSRFGLMLAVPISGGHAISLSIATGVTTRYGADFNIFTCSYRYRWGGR